MRILLILSLLLLSRLSFGQIYVNHAAAMGSGDGSSWTNAYTDLQDAIDAANTGDEIWVAQGTYYPSRIPMGVTSTNTRDRSFHLNKDVRIYGGFDATETMLSERNHQANPTILSGDIGTLNSTSDNCYHVFITANLTSAAVLDGFRVTGGNADGTGSLSYTSIPFGRASGGGIHNSSSSSSISNCNFYNNTAVSGGGIYNFYSSLVLSNCNFYNNTAGFGGGINNASFIPSVLSNCNFYNNAASSGGGMWNDGIGPILSNCNFYKNTAGNGGGMYNETSNVSTPCNPIISNCIFVENTANLDGGGMYNNWVSSPDITNCIFWGNKEGTNEMASGADIENDTGGANPTISHSLLQGYTGSTSNSITGQNPLFVNESDPDGADDIPGTADDGLRLRSCSPARDAGQDYSANPNVPVLDILGNGRLAATDMGCYEFRLTSIPARIYVDIDATGLGDGGSWADAHTDLQDAIDYACDGEEIWVAQGTYYPSRIPTGATGTNTRDRSFHLNKDVKIYGGFDATETMLSDRDHQANPTILSGNIGMLNDDADNCYHVFITANLTSGAVLDGFHITGGNADDGVGALTYIGLIFNRAFGGGMYSRASSLSIISNCNFYGNRSIAEGGGMYNSNSSPEVSNCNFYGNMADAEGGGMYNSISSPKVSNCNFYDNTATNFGGGMYNLSSSPRVSNCSFYNNRADDGGGGMYNIDPASTPDIINCIFWANMENGNTMSSGAHINNNMGGGNPTISHSLLQVYTGSTSTSIIGQNPLFVNESDPDGADDIPGTADDGLRLHSCSPARDAGEDYGANPNVPVLDILGNGRLAATDMGCYEYQTASVHVYVNHSATGANNGTTWANAYTNLQDALDYACEGEEIWVAEGIYSPSRVPIGVTSTDIRDRSFHLDKDVGIYGGFNATETLLSERDNKANSTILSGATDDCYHVFITTDLTSAAVLDGFRITSGNANGVGSLGYSSGNFDRRYGGGIYNFSSSPSILNCDLYDNGATSSGGGMYSLSSSPIISNCNFYDNTAASGGGISNRSSLTHVSNCNFYDNASTDKGGGMYNNNLSASIVSNCNFYDNTADNNGGGMYNHNSSSPEITNCIFWKNSSGVGADSDIENDGSGSSPTVGHSLLQVYTGGMNNMTGTDPLFVDESDPDGADDIPGTSDDGLRLRTCSPARDVGQDNGSNSDVPVSDILGNGRLGITDMGCYEYQTPIPIRIYVNIGVIGGMGDGSSWGNAYTNLQDAIDSACTLDEIWVAEGTYHPTDIPDGATATTSRDRSFHLNKDLKIYGGFDATETLLSERNHQANPTILSGDIGVPNDASDNCHHVFITTGLTSDAVLDGFGIMGGNADNSSTSITYLGYGFPRKHGSGMYNIISSPKISNCNFYDNTSMDNGGGMYNNISSSPIVSNCNFYNNTASSNGGGIYNNNNSSPIVSNCNFYNNTANNSGGGISNIISSPIVSNCNFYNNSAGFNGGGISNVGSSPSIINCIFWNNKIGTDTMAPGADIESGGSPTVSHSLLQVYAGSTSNSIIGQDPIFMDGSDPDGVDDIPGTADDGLKLRSCSPARDVGQDNSNNPDVPVLDILGNGRLGATDMGCYEYQTSIPISIYVDINVPTGGLNNGSSWANAYTDLQDAIDYACAGDEIWVARGTYHPSRVPMMAFVLGGGSLGNRDYAFHLNKDVEIYGGFNATETMLSDRNHQANPTILSGDIGVPNNASDNCHHVFITTGLTSATVLDGFGITGGNADAFTSNPIRYEGRDFSRNSGGGIYNILSDPTISNCNFYDNSAYFGGGLYNSSSSPNVSNCNLYDNVGYIKGGGMYNSSSSPIVSNCNFYSNTADNDGGGMYNSSSYPIISNCNFYNNTADNDGGGIYTHNSSPSITNCIFWENSSMIATGADIENNGGSPTISYSLLQNSWSGTGNIAGQNPLFVDGSDPDGADDIPGTADDGLRLRPCSPAHDAGDNNTSIPTLDILGNGRLAATDMGCYEYQMTGPIHIYVDIDATGGMNTGDSWADAYTDLQDAIDYACIGNEIWVAEGTYHPSRVPMGATVSSGSLTSRDYTFHLNKDVRIYGGFNATETMLSERDYQTNPTILSGDIGALNAASDNCHHVFITANLTPAAVLDGFGITGGNANGNNLSYFSYEGKNFYRGFGGGMYNDSSSPKILNCNFYNNTADDSGGGMGNADSPLIISNCNFYNNTASEGGGMNNTDSPLIISNCNFYNNTAGKGGGMNNLFSSLEVSNCNFYNNTANYDGGGIYIYSSSPSITNCIFWDNKENSSTTATGADIENNGSSPTISHSLLQNSWFGTGNIDGMDPLFVDGSDPDGADDILGTSDDGLRLRPCSPARDAGEDNSNDPNVPVLDILGNGRFGLTDMGCYEYQMVSSPTPIYVDIDATGSGDGGSWADAYTDLQDAIDYACTGEEIWVAEGTYHPSRVPTGATMSSGSLTNQDYAFHLNKDVRIYGGFDATETLLSDRNHKMNPTILSGASDNCHHVFITVDLTSTAVLDGFRITGGNANGGASSLNYVGGNFDRKYGGGMYNFSSSPSVSNCDFHNNTADSSGGGMYSLSSSPIMSNCNIYDNTAASGGGISNRSSLMNISNCNFYNNASTDKGGGMYNNLSATIVSNCNFYNNTANNNGGGMYNYNSSSPDIINCIFWKNSSITAADSDIEGDGSGGPTVSYSLLQIYAGSMTNSIVGQNPLFVDESDPDGADDIPGTADDGLRLRPCSPVRDAGQDNASNSDVPILDILGNGRSGTTDMGCYENQATGPIRMYVDINVAMGGMGDGSTWNDAYTDLQDAIDYACDGDEIWVAEGTYYPSRIPMGAFSSTGSLGTRDYAFHLNKDVKIYGGFNATETLLSERNHQTNPTILSGDIGTPNDSNDNCYHIIITMTATSAALLDGFHIMGGTANGGTSTLDYAGVGFERGYGGGMYNILSFPSISNCNFYENMADKGGGMYNYLASSSSISNCNFYNNTADVGGGGMYNYNSSSPHVSNCNFYSNTTNGDGGGIHNSSASPIMVNCNFYENTANSDGGGIYSVVNSNPEVFNCIFWKNKENNNTAISGSDIEDVGGVSSTVSHSLLQVYTGGMTNSIVGLNPLFVDESDPDGADDISGTADDGLRLRPCSPALDAGEDNGSNPNVPVLDILGNGRLAATDMGCYEYQMTSSSPHIYVDIDATGMDDGSSWADAYADLQDAIDHACAGEEIWVAEGTYYPSRVPMGATIPIGSLTNRDHAFLLSKDVRIYGGFDATETMLSERNHQTNPTILSGASDNCYHVLITAGLTSTAVLDGFRITEGNADGTNILNYNNTGYYFNRNICGGMYNIDSSPSVSDCSFYNNNTIGIGGGMYNNNSSPSVSACNFYNNTAAGNGGGMCNYYSSSPTVSNCNFYDNMVNYEGGGMYNSSSSPKVSNCNFYRNTADTGGGGIYNNFSASSDIINCIFWANEENGTTTAANSDIKNDGMSNSSTITHSLLQVYTGGTSNITGQDPLFVDESDPDGADDIPSTADDGLALQPCSPAINVGTTTSPIIPTDILGNLRVGVYDMGAYENQNPSSFLAGGVIYVDVDAVGNNDGTSWTDAFTDLQFALDVYCVNSDVWVAKGTYIPSVSPTGGSDARDKTFFLPDGVAIYGGFEGMESTLTARDIPNNPTILNGNMGAVGNAYHVILASADASTGIGVTIDGFSIMGGNADSNTSTTINTNNMGRNYGGGITISNGSNVIANNIIHSNAANFGGGGINIRGGTNTLDNNVIHSNAANFGGGISAFDGVNTFHGNVMYSNTAVFYGGAFYLDDNVNVLENNTIYSNIADNLGGGVFSNSGTNTLRNNILWGNIRAGNDDVAGADIKRASGTLAVEYCLTQENSDYSTSTGNVDNENPLFMDASDPDGADNIFGTADDGLGLQSCSPAINVGTTTSLPIPTDILGNPRVGAYDMGAYENQSPGATDGNAALAMSDLSLTLNQTGDTYYGNDCSTLIARVEQSGSTPVSGMVDAKVWFDASVMQMGQPYVQRHFEITPNAGAGTATGRVTLYFLQSEFDAFNTDPTSTLDLPANSGDTGGISNLRITKFSGVSNDGTGNPDSYGTAPFLIDPTDTDIIWNSVMSRWEVSFLVTGFSGFFAHTGGTPLPVELLDFSGRADGADNHLTWTTASETDNHGFYVEHSTDGQSFQEIGWVDGHGTTTEQMDYEFLHRNPTSSINYYRLEQLDYDGTSEYSDVISIRNESEGSMVIFPNPTSGIVRIRAEERNRSLRVTDMTGKILQTYDYIPERITLESLPSGIYTIRVGTEAIMIVKERSN